MTGKQAIKILRRFNKRRRGEKGKQPDPKQVGEAIDVAVAIIEHYTMTGEMDRFHIKIDKSKRYAKR